MSVVTLEQMQKTGPSKGILHRVEENKSNRKDIRFASGNFAVNLGPAIQQAQDLEMQSWSDVSVHQMLRTLYELERSVKRSIDVMRAQINFVTFTEEMIPEEDLEEACV